MLLLFLISLLFWCISLPRVVTLTTLRPAKRFKIKESSTRRREAGERGRFADLQTDPGKSRWSPAAGSRDKFQRQGGALSRTQTAARFEEIDCFPQPLKDSMNSNNVTKVIGCCLQEGHVPGTGWGVVLQSDSCKVRGD